MPLSRGRTARCITFGKASSLTAVHNEPVIWREIRNIEQKHGLNKTINAWRLFSESLITGWAGRPHLRAMSVSVPRGLGDALERSHAIARVLIYGVQRSPIAV